MHPTCACAVVLLCSVVRTQQLVNFTVKHDNVSESELQENSDHKLTTVYNETSFSEENNEEENLLQKPASTPFDTTKNDLWEKLLHHLKKVSHANNTVNFTSAEKYDTTEDNSRSDEWAFSPIQSDQAYSELDDISLSSLEGLTDDEIWQRLIRKESEKEEYQESYHDYESVSEPESKPSKSVKEEKGHDTLTSKLKNSDERLIINLLNVSGNAEDPVTRRRRISHHCVDGTCPESSSDAPTAKQAGYQPVREIKLSDVDKFLSTEFQNDASRTASAGPKDAKGSSSLAIVFDTTGSMWDDLVQVRHGIKSIIATMLERPDKPIQDYVLVPFHDPKILPVTVTTDHRQLMQALDAIDIYGGTDCPEMVVGAIQQALVASRPNSYIYVFTDARAKDYHLVNQVLPLIERKQSQVVFVMTGDCGDRTHPGYTVFQQIAATSSGQVYHLNKSDVDEVLTFVKVSLNSHKVNLLSVDRPAAPKPEDLPLAVDETLKEFTVSVSGKNPKIGVVDPKGQETLPPRLQPLLDLQNVKVVNVKEPDPGVWTLKVGSESQHTVRTTGLSGSDFIYGFSVIPTTNMAETNHRPLKSAMNSVLVRATQPDNVHNLTTLEVTYINGTQANVIELHPVPGQPGVYSGGPFVPPTEFFYLGINGFGKNNSILKRITPTAISSQNPELPFVTMVPSYLGQSGHSLTLRCNVESLVPVSVRWFKDGASKSRTLKYNQTAEVPLHLDELTKKDEGTYICRASNVAGTSYKETKVTISGPPPQVETDNRVSGTVKKDVSLRCNVNSDSPYNVSWSRIVDSVGTSGRKHVLQIEPLQDTPRFSVIQNNNLVISPALPSDQGWYICSAQNDGGSATGRVYLTLEEIPAVRVLPQKADFRTGTNFALRCHIASGIPFPTIAWKKDGRMIEDSVTRRGEFVWEVVVRNAQNKDEGNYTCEAENSAGTASDTGYMRYIEAPEAIAEENSKLVKEGETVTLRCMVKGIPTPQISWYKETQPIKQTTSPKMQLMEDGSLQIPSVEDLDAGQYSCVAENQLGASHDFIDLQVGTSPRIVQLPADTNIPIGSSGSILCAAIGLPVPQITWTKHGVPLDHNRFEINDSGRLKIKEASIEDEGTYTCSVENMFGKKTFSAEIKITGIVAPKLAEERVPSVTKALFGDSVQLVCPILEANPVPTRKWYKDSLLLDMNSINTDIFFESDGSLTINKMTAHNVGQYECVVQNVGGEAKIITTLQAYVPPRIDETTQPLNKVILGGDVILSCHVEGDPAPEVFWLKNGQNLPPSRQKGMELLIENATVEDDGKYLCVAGNAAGTATKAFQLNVLVPPTITEWDSTVNVTSGNEAELDCRVEADPPAKISWFREQLPLPYTTSKVRFPANKTSEGQYSCVAENDAGMVSKHLNLYVYLPPKFVVDEINEQPVKKAILGDDVILKCPVQGDPLPEISWLKDGHPIPKSQQVKDELRIVSAKKDDNGKYVCVATNEAGTATRTVELDVFSPPVISNWKDAVNVTNNEEVTLNCDVEAYPPANITWYHDQQRLPFHSSKIKLTVNKTDEGQYSCRAENEAGIDQKHLNLFVAVPPQIHPSTPKHVKGVAGEEVILECNVHGDPPPQVSWIKDGFTIERMDEADTSLTLVNLTTIHSGTYICTATNSAGIDSHEVSLVVMVGPKITKWEENLDIVAGQGVTLYCEVIADPPYRITWFKDGKQLKAYGQTLRFAAKADDSGIYTCMAENEAGTDRQDITVSVTVPAYISPSKEETVSVVAGSDNDVRLVCNADGIPAPSIFWIKNSANVTENDHFTLEGNTLIIHNTTSDMSGTYICDAENPGGIAQKVFNFNVYETPKVLDTFATKVQLREGDDYSLACTANGIPTPHISWQKGKLQLAAGHHDDEVLVMQDNTLVLTSVSLKTSGVYSCVAENIAGMDSRNYTIDVLVPPISVDSSVTKVEIYESTTGVLTCPANKGTPRPEFQWLKNDYPINFTAANVRADDVHYNLKDGGRSLKIVEARPDDNGIYTCIASNLAGSTQTSFAVDVLVRPHFIEDFPETHFTRTEGEELILDCSIEGNPLPKMSWKRVELGLPVTEHTAPGVIVQSPLRQTLRIPNVKRHHAGTYQCNAANKAGRERRQFKLNVIAKPELDGPAEEHLEVVKGESTVLQCRVFGAPTPKVTWTHDDSTNTIKITNTGSDWRLFELNNMTSENSGIYTCTGENSAGSVTKLFNITVLEPPTITKVYATKEGKIKEGEDLTLTCIAHGVPEPVVTWLYGGHVIANTTKTAEHTYVIHLPSVHSTSGGKYICVASNKVGSSESTYRVRILVAPKLSKHRWSHANDKIASLEGLPLIIKCPVVGSPSPDISWMKNDIPLNVNREMLHIGTARKEHTGNYTCVATNNAGNISKSFLVDVLVAPKFLDEEPVKYLQVLSNSTLQLDCSVRGHPIPSLLWLRGTEPIDSFLGPRTYFINFNQTLVMEHVGVDQSAQYSCLASNLAGAMEKSFHLEVLEPPSMDEGMVRNGTVSEIKALLYRKVVIECPLSGSPEPNITWYKEGTTLNHGYFSKNGRELHIMSASINDAGNYTCLAENQAGLKELLFSLKVIVPLKWSEWSTWSSCSVSCGGGKAVRSRRCGKEEGLTVKHEVLYDKAACQGDSKESRSCNAVPCQVAGNWGEWSPWTSCSETCGRATRRRYRACDSPPPSYGGAPCIGSDAQQEYCLMGPCPVAAYWGEWTEWSPCSASCNRGTKVRERRCIRGDDGQTTTICEGQDREEVPCNFRRCPEDGKWGSWSEWSPCSVSCGRGTRRRIRTCIRSRFGGLPCKGDNVEIEECRLTACNKASNKLKSASLKVRGMLNGEELQDTYIDANINHYGSRGVVTATLEDILKQQAGWFPYLSFLLPPVSWNSAHEQENANNGYSLTNGNFNQESRYQFATGEELVVNHAGRGINKDGALQVDIEITGKVPLVEPRASVVIDPYTEDYVQTGPNSLYAASHGNLGIDGQRLPYKWNKTVQYDTELGTMPYLVERMSTRDIRTKYNPKSHEIKFEAASEISRISDKDKCPQGFKLDTRHQHCTDIDECQEARHSVCHHSQICENHFGSYKCVCRKGFRMSHNRKRCVDINECVEGNPCSHDCQNTKGSYRCLCPRSFVLDTDGITCTSWRGNDDYRDAGDNDYYDVGSQDVSSMGDYVEHKQPQEQFVCKPGYTLNGDTCSDFDECSVDDACKLQEICINLIGSHQCLDTPCPSNYRLDLETGKCMQLCGERGVKCSLNASVAEIMSFTAVPLSGIVHPYQDIITLVGKGLKEQILPRTVFTITENESGLPLRVRIENGHGVLYAMKYFELQDIYKVTILASSFDADNKKLQYATKFVIYIYSPDSVQL